MEKTIGQTSILAADREALDAYQDGELGYEDAAGRTNCPEKCVVEPDGECPHGYLALGRRLI